MIGVENLSKVYGDLAALNGLNFSVNPGEVVGLVGKNGAGKSTVLKVLSCQLLPTAGSVTVAGLDVTKAPLIVRRQIGFLPETPPIYPEMTVSAYLEFAAGLRRYPREQLPARLAEVMARTGLEAVAAIPLGQLSRGYQQRAGIAQAIVHDPSVVLLDEPMAGLDPLQIIHIRDLIRSLRPAHTVLFSSHILSEITNICDRVILIDRGQVAAQGTEESLWATLGQRQMLRLVVRGAESAVKQWANALSQTEIKAINALGEGRFSVEMMTAGDQRETIGQACFSAGLGLLELRGERHGLEELFVHVLEGGVSPEETRP